MASGHYSNSLLWTSKLAVDVLGLPQHTEMLRHSDTGVGTGWMDILGVSGVKGIISLGCLGLRE